jgi:hypothetical protein
MLKELMIHGIALPTGLLKMSVALDGEQIEHYYRQPTWVNFRNILKQCGFSPEDVIYIMQDEPQSFTITATFSEQKKIPEKNGQT